MIRNMYPLPLIPQLINKARSRALFTKFDVRWGYNNVRIRDGDQWKAAFITNEGLFELTIRGVQSCPYFLLIGYLFGHLFCHLFDKENEK